MLAGAGFEADIDGKTFNPCTWKFTLFIQVLLCTGIDSQQLPLCNRLHISAIAARAHKSLELYQRYHCCAQRDGQPAYFYLQAAEAAIKRRRFAQAARASPSQVCAWLAFWRKKRKKTKSN